MDHQGVHVSSYVIKVYSRIVRSIYRMMKSVDAESVELSDNLKAFSQPVAYRCCAMGRTLRYFGEGRGVAPHGWAAPGDQIFRWVVGGTAPPRNCSLRAGVWGCGWRGENRVFCDPG